MPDDLPKNTDELTWEDYKNQLEKLEEHSLQVLATRSALRVFPLSLDCKNWDDVDTRQLTLMAFRANFISWASHRYPAHEMKASGFSAFSAARLAARSTHITTVGSAIESAAESVGYYAPFSAPISAALSAAVSASESAAESVSFSSLYSEAVSTARSAAYSDALSVRNSAIQTQIQSRPLWRDASGLKAIIDQQRALIKKLPAFQKANSNSWKLIYSWWENLAPNPSRSLFGEEKDILLASQNGPFWGDDLKEPDPDAVIDRIKELLRTYSSDDEEELAQRPATYAFATTDGKIVARPLADTPFDAALAEDLRSELLEKLQELQSRLERTQAPRRIQNTIDRLIAALGNSVDGIRPGTLFSRSRSLESDAATYATEEALKEVDPEVVSMMADAAATLEDLTGLYPQLAKLKANILANRLQEDDAETALEPLSKIVTIAGTAPFVDQTAKDALEDAAPEIATTTEQILDARSPDIRAEAIEMRSEAIASQMMVVRNFVSALIKLGREKSGTISKEEMERLLKALDNGVLENPSTPTRIAVLALLVTLLPHISPLALFSLPYQTLEKLLRKLLDQRSK